MASRDTPRAGPPARGLQWLLMLAALVTFAVAGARLLEAARDTPEALLARQLDAQVVDRPAPPLTVGLRDGSTLDLADLRGRVVFVNFWATWCPPCRKEIPDLERLAEKLEGLPFEILAVGADEKWEDVDAFFGGQRTRMRLALEPTQQAARRYGTELLPETYVVDPTGRVRLRFVGIQPWTDDRIHRYLERLASRG